MDPLQAVEDILGNVESWPSYVIYNIFIQEPCPSRIKKIAAFMCGNGVPLDIAVECFNTCSGLHCSLVTQTMSKWYSTWDRHPRKKYKAEYYSISFKEWLKINGEAVRPEVTVMQFGIDGIDETAIPEKVRTIIDHVRLKSVDIQRQ